VPSISTETETEVSLVLRDTLPVRFKPLSAIPMPVFAASQVSGCLSGHEPRIQHWPGKNDAGLYFGPSSLHKFATSRRNRGARKSISKFDEKNRDQYE
jgi:hypothetical protein